MSDLATFERHRAHLLNIAYRMLGEMAGAEDVVQEAWLRWRRTAGEDIRDPRAWLSAATVRLSLDALRKGRTTFIIAHRLSTVANADKILVLERGAIIERGKFRELVAQGGLFARLVAEGGFTEPTEVEEKTPAK